MNMNWTGTVPGPRDFTFEATISESFSLSSTADWNRAALIVDPLIPFSSLELVGNGQTVDLLATASGTLPAGSYQILGAAYGEWAFDELSFLHQNTLFINFDKSAVVPEPTTSLLIAVCGLSLFRRRRDVF